MEHLPKFYLVLTLRIRSSKQMAFIGAGINTVKGILTRVLNKRKIKKLERIHESDVIDLISLENKAQAAISLKQTHHLHRAFEGASRKELSQIEKEIVCLMQKNIEEKRSDLASKEATQLDIANLLITIQKYATEAADEIDKQGNNIANFSEKSLRRYRYHSVFLVLTLLISTASLLKAMNII